ncbi:hypothetical protein D3C78_1608480 [compost metagenome]
MHSRYLLHKVQASVLLACQILDGFLLLVRQTFLMQLRQRLPVHLGVVTIGVLAHYQLHLMDILIGFR